MGKSLILASLFLIAPLAFSQSIIDGSFKDAKEAATAAGEQGQGANQNTGSAEAVRKLDRGETAKAISDYTGMAATTAAIGTLIYDQFSDQEREKLEQLDAAYAAALQSGNKEQAANILAQIDAIKKEKRVTAKNQADIQENLGTVQTVAGIANLGAASASFYSAYEAHTAASKLDATENRCGAVRGDLTALKACMAADDRGKKGASDKAVSKAQSARNTALIYGVGETVVGVGSLYLAKEHNENADNMNSLADDPNAGLNSSQELAYYDKLAMQKCGSGAQYEIIQDPSLDPASRVRCITTKTMVNSAGQTVIANSGYTAPVKCTNDAILCADGSFSTRDPARSCDFRPCPGGTIPRATPPPVVSSPAPSSPSTPAPSPSSPTRSLANTNEDVVSSGASRMPVEDMGKEVDQERNKLLKDGF